MKKREKGRARELRGTRCNDNAFCRMTDSFHIAGGCCRCVGGREDEAMDTFSLSNTLS